MVRCGSVLLTSSGHLCLQGPDIQPGVPITETLHESCPVVWGSLHVSPTLPPPFLGVCEPLCAPATRRHHVFLHLRWVRRREAAVGGVYSPRSQTGTSIPRTPSLAARRTRMQGGSNDGEAEDLGPVLLFSSAVHDHGSTSPSAALAEADAGVGANGGAKRKRGDRGCAADGGERGAGQECVLFAGGSGSSTCLGPSPCPVVRPIQVEVGLCLMTRELAGACSVGSGCERTTGEWPMQGGCLCRSCRPSSRTRGVCPACRRCLHVMMRACLHGSCLSRVG